MDISFVTRNLVNNLTVIGNMAAGICKSLNLMVIQAKATTIKQPWIIATNLSFADPDEEITCSSYAY